MRAERLEPKGYAVESGCLTSFRRELKGLSVYRADLNPPVLNAEHGNAASPKTSELGILMGGMHFAAGIPA